MGGLPFMQSALILIVAILLVPIVLFCLSFFPYWLKRLSLKGKLERFCRKKGFEITWLRDPLESMKKKDCKFDFTVQTGEKKYHVAILSARYRYREHCFVSSDTLQVNRALKVGRMKKGGRNPKKKSANLAVFTRPFQIDLEAQVPSEDVKIILFYPIAKEVTAVRGGSKIYLDNGEEVYKFYYLLSLSAFFKQLTGEKNYIHKRKPWEYD